MPLTDVVIRKAKSDKKQYKLSDEKGFFLLIHPNGSKYWRLKYYIDGKEKGPLSLGVYPEVSLAEARKKRDEAQKMISNGVNPALAKKLFKHSAKITAENSFETIAREWLIKHSSSWGPEHDKRLIGDLKKDIFPWIGTRPIAEITPSELLAALRRIEERGAIETAHRAHQTCGRIFRYAVATGRAERDPSGDLRGAIPPAKKRNFASIKEPKAIGGLLRAINSYQGHFVTRCALRLAPLVFVRPGELRKAEWFEFDLENAEWRIPAEKMKIRIMHIIPLSTQAIAILRDLQPATGNGKYLFPSLRSDDRPMSENTVLGALRRLGYTKEEMTGHRFRSMAS